MSTELAVTLTCPSCSAHALETIPLDACIVEYICPDCGAPLRPLPGDGCVFCSYGDVNCDNLSYAQERFGTARCLPDPDERSHVTLGVSPFNSYYSESRLAALFEWSVSHFKRIHAFVPDTPTRWTLEAGGYSPHEAARKTKRQIKYLKNKIERAVPDARVQGAPIAVLLWSSMAETTVYQQLHERCKLAFTDDAAFRTACLNATDEVLENRCRSEYTPDNAGRSKAVNYLMAELPLILFGPTLMNVPTSTFVYHRPLALFEQLFSGEFRIRPASGQHFVIATELASTA